MTKVLHGEYVAVNRPMACEDCATPMKLRLEIVEDADFYASVEGMPSGGILLDWRCEWECDPCGTAYSFEYADDLDAEDMARLEAEAERLIPLAIEKLEAEKAKERADKRATRLAEQRRLQRMKH